MAENRRTQFPEAALDWMVAGENQKVLALGASGVPRTLVAKGNQLTVVDKNPEKLTSLFTQNGIRIICGLAESLPFQPCQFEVVTVHQVFHRFAPGLVLSELARVLKPGGHVAVSYLVRDDTVPWVKRLAGLVQSVNPNAMNSSFGVESLDDLLSSKYFPTVDYRDFRIWVPVSKDAMLEMARQAASAATDSECERLLGSVGALYDEYSSGIENLKLPYQLRCWRAWVDHAELTAPIDIEDSGLVIPI